MSKQDKPTSRMARHAPKPTRRNSAATPTKQPISSLSQAPKKRQPFITRHRWSLITIVVLIVAFGIYAEFSSITSDNQAAEPTAVTSSDSSSAASSTTASSSHHKASSKTATSKASSAADTESSAAASSASTSSAASSTTASSTAGGDGQTFSSTSAAVAWGQANASSWMAAGYSNFTVVANGAGGYTIEYTK
ncbi:hypothetical protein [Loigolactobacillus binensis]|uniref:Uncharacterized protein n=1 Tax=Loigolactobacillus binensis TaxID=2559922 RepID=A0ABW3EH64_9LACO|nr:hypothetical protein [Loigolactobacillus binensis]